MTLHDALKSTPRLPLDEDGGPVFEAPWQARVFAMTVQAHESGMFEWTEWAEALGKELAKDGDGSVETPGYYDRWLNAFETILRSKGVAGAGQLRELRQAWDAAARATPHGEPIELKR
ncbi:nitrile hydratase accessory protein [Roseibium sp. MMSF_3412]|uniref:nitrile hydratase accessory protein n=1 Tax=Roseibium sp. MMSF_3412 TaxID=3046712 RepID=UPI00273D905A|nr:nitrile hydratase accessory protein [Roseibium sp. MMSF_3412]